MLDEIQEAIWAVHRRRRAGRREVLAVKADPREACAAREDELLLVEVRDVADLS